ncbi:MAG TPA: sigma-70 family RNA polymerase sigma factor, partial [Gemmataceae bacterium]|nr:sigma-70 family RNA polymerase sigma factor [Gemmataceae bacterium]
MPAQPLQGLLHKLRQTVSQRDRPAEDGLLVRSFVAGRDEAAFARLVQCHGPMVFGVCRRILGNVPDAEDAFQATFLVLARKAASVRPPERVGNWLYGVACRTALAARARARRRNAREKPMAELPHPAVEGSSDANDLRQLLDRELSRLPDKYRTAVVLCELEGRSRKEVARLLGVPEGTLSSRLAAARRLLAGRLGARGRAVSVTAVAAVLAGEVTRAAAAPPPGAASPSARATFLAEKVMHALFLAKLKGVAAAALVLGLTAAGLTPLTGYALSARGAHAEPPVRRENHSRQATRTETRPEPGPARQNDPPTPDPLAAFTGVQVKGGTVVIRQTGRQALVGGGPRPDARVEDGTLVLAAANPGVEFTVEVKELRRLQVAGVGKVTAVGLKGKRLEVRVTGPATVILAGTVEEQTIQAAAGSTVDAQACAGKTVAVNVAAGGHAIVHAADALSATVAAGGTVEYFGSPKLADNVRPGGTLVSRDGPPAGGPSPPTPPPSGEGPGAKGGAPAPKGAVVLTAVVEGYTQGTMFNTQKYPFKYTGTSVLRADQLRGLARAGDVPRDIAEALCSCLL